MQKFRQIDNPADNERVEIFNAVEQSRVEAQGSDIFKGINKNILNKHKIDLNNIILKNDKDSEIIKAFKYVSYSELSDNKLDGNYKVY